MSLTRSLWNSCSSGLASPTVVSSSPTRCQVGSLSVSVLISPLSLYLSSISHSLSLFLISFLLPNFLSLPLSDLHPFISLSLYPPLFLVLSHPIQTSICLLNPSLIEFCYVCPAASHPSSAIFESFRGS